MDNFDSFVDDVLAGNDRPTPQPQQAAESPGMLRGFWNKLRKQKDWQCPRCKGRVVLSADETPPRICAACVKADARKAEIARERAEKIRLLKEEAARREAFRRKIVGICVAAGIVIISVPVLLVSLILTGLSFGPNPAPAPVTPVVYPQRNTPPAEPAPAPATPSYSGAAPSYSPPADDDRVHVRGYTRQDGTYVAPYTRSKPTRSK